MSSRWIAPVAIAAALFGLATLYSGGTALFGSPETRTALGDYVAFVLWFNFSMGLAYLVGAALLVLHHPAAQAVAKFIGLATLAVFALFVIAALSGTPYEMRTVGAMILRAGFWLAIATTLKRTEA